MQPLYCLSAQTVKWSSQAFNQAIECSQVSQISNDFEQGDACMYVLVVCETVYALPRCYRSTSPLLSILWTTSAVQTRIVAGLHARQADNCKQEIAVIEDFRDYSGVVVVAV